MNDTAGIDEFLAARDLLLNARGDYATAYRQFSWPRPERFNWALDYFDGVLATQRPDQDALRLIEDDGSRAGYTFGQLSRSSSRLAGWLAANGVSRGMRVLLVLGNQVELWESMLACMKLGAVIIPASTLLSPADLADRLERGAVGAVISRSDLTAGFGSAPAGCVAVAAGEPVPGWLDYAEAAGFDQPYQPDVPTVGTDPLLLYFTSGTTAQPKLVEHTHLSYPVGHLSTMYWIGLRPGDVHLNVSSPGWAKHAWSCFFAPWNAGATVVLFNYARFDAARLLDVLAEAGVSTFCAPPTVWRMLVQQDLSRWQLSLREVVGAGEPLNSEVIERVQRAWSLTIRDGFGQTETTAQIGNPPGELVKPGSMGRPLPGYRVVLADPVTGQRLQAEGASQRGTSEERTEVAAPAEGASQRGTSDERTEVAAPAEGEICLDLAERPVGLMVGYRDDAERNDTAMAHGLYHTGDVATIDSDGYVTYVGRTDDVFKSSDYRISPFELESVLVTHPAVAEAAVVPAPDPVRLSVPKAYVTLAAGYSPSAELAGQILVFCREQLAPYKRIRRLEFAELPKTISGKIRRVDLRRAEDGRGQQRAAGEYREEDLSS
ncbi:MAG TPA: AMP-binding protein [Jatrophihabitans sp.]|jgi:acetyl-CoA synthetase|uniref:AMP-binding protein n=1 Tax=Jatrophihabitans sp. TaxID=1932789 RepID=UPI002F05F99C